MDDIRRHAKDIDKALGDDLEKSGREAGKRAGKALGEEIGKAAKDIDLPDIEPEIDDKKAVRQLGSFERKVKESAKKAAKALGDSFHPEVARVKRELDSIHDVEVDATFDSAAALAKIRALASELERVDHTKIDIGTEADIAGALTSLLVLDRAAERLDGKDVEIDVDVKGGAAAAAQLESIGASTRHASAGGQEVANSFRAFNGVILASVTLLPALIPALAAVGGGLIALLPILGAVTAGIGTMIIGFSGVGDAVGALSDVQDSAAKDSLAAGKTMSAAANSVADAQLALARARQQAAWAEADAARAVARAREAAAEAIAEAIDRQREAQEDYRDAVKEVKEAEADLAQARKDAAQELLDLQNQVSQNAIDVDQGVIDVFNAQVNYNNVMGDGSSTNLDKDVARLELEQAELTLKELREEQARLAQEKTKADKTGVDGTDTVKNAQDHLTAAIEAQQEAQEALGDASKEVDKARIEGARAVADALRAQRRTAISSAQAIADAQRNLKRAQEGYGDAVQQTGDIGSAAMQKLELAMGKLSPAGRRFARFLFSLRGDFYKLRAAIQEAMLPPLQRAITRFLSTYGPQMNGFFVRMARVVGRLFVDLEKSLEGPVWRKFFAMMGRFGPKLLRQFGKTTINWMEIFARLLTIAGPAALALSKAMLRISRAILDWVKSKEGTETIQRFLEYARKIGPKVAEFFGNLAVAILAVLEALAPWGALILDALNIFLEFIASMDPKTLGLIITTIFVLVAAFQLGAGAVAAIGAGTALFASTIGVAVLAVVLIVGLLAVLYVRFETVRKVIDKVAKAWWIFAQFMFNFYRVILTAVAKGIIWFVTEIFIPYWKKIWPTVQSAFQAIVRAWQNVLWPAIQGIAKAVVWLWRKVFAPVFKAIWSVVKTAFGIIKTVWTNILWPILDLVGTVIWKLWTTFWGPAIRKIRAVWHDFVTGAKYVWETVLAPLLNDIKDKVLPKFQSAWETVVENIGKAWGLLKKYVAEPIVALFDLVVNKGLVAGFNQIAKFVGSDEMKPINLPFDASGSAVKRADGGMLPGYTPGRDVHKFYSPTGGLLELSGGEPVMRPEFGKVVGKGWVDQMNHIARTRGVGGVRDALGRGNRYARGGIFFPVPGGYVERTAYNLGHDGMDINHKDDGGPTGQGGVVPYYSATSGTVTTGSGYGDAIFVNSPYGKLVYGHSYPGSRLVSPGSPVTPGQRLALIGNTGNSSGPHLHFGFPGGTFYQAEALLAGATQASYGGGKSVQPASKYPDFIAKILKGPTDWAKGLIEGPLDKVQSLYSSPLTNILTKMPGKLIGGFVDKVLDVIPAKSAFDAAGHLISGARDVAGDLAEAGGFSRGGIYNGVMKYDAGGMLPPGLTSVLNLTGKPEPVFTSDQFDTINPGNGESFTYAPTFNGSNLTAADLVDDMDIARRKIAREGRYRRNR